MRASVKLRTFVGLAIVASTCPAKAPPAGRPAGLIAMFERSQPITLETIIRYKFVLGRLDLRVQRDAIVASSARTAIAEASSIPTGDPAISKGFKCDRAHREGNLAAMIVTVDMSRSPAEARENWAAVTRWKNQALRRVFSMLRKNSPNASQGSGDVRRQLDRRVAADRAWRTVFEEVPGEVRFRPAVRSAIWPMLCESDLRNARWLYSYVRKNGWPTITSVGREAAGGAWLLTQHADINPAFQKWVLSKMEPLLAAEEVDPEAYAYLFDRLAVAEHRPQRYGTQVDRDRIRNCLSVGATEEPKKLDSRRAAVGLSPLADYLSQFVEGPEDQIC
jgi:hypothetical protein